MALTCFTFENDVNSTCVVITPDVSSDLKILVLSLQVSKDYLVASMKESHSTNG